LDGGLGSLFSDEGYFFESLSSADLSNFFSSVFLSEGFSDFLLGVFLSDFESSDFFSSDFFYSDFFPSVWPFFPLPSVGLGLGVEGCYFSDSSNKFFKFYFLGLFSFFLLNINFSRLTLACD